MDLIDDLKELLRTYEKIKVEEKSQRLFLLPGRLLLKRVLINLLLEPKYGTESEYETERVPPLIFSD